MTFGFWAWRQIVPIRRKHFECFAVTIITCRISVSFVTSTSLLDATPPALGSVTAVGKAKGLDPEQSKLLGVEVVKILTWREAMVDLAQVLLDVEPFFNGGAKDPDSDEFKDLQKRLRDKVGEVAKESRAQWGDPWGIVALTYLAGQAGSKRAKVSSEKVRIDVRKPRAAAVA